MIQFVIVNKNTGEIEGNCSYCGIISVSSYEVFRDYAVDENHLKYLLDPKKEEHILIQQIDRTKGAYKNKIKVEDIDTKRRLCKGRLIDI